MKLSDSIHRNPLLVAFGQSQQTGGLTSVDLEAVRDETSVTLTASDGSVAPVDGADASTAGVMTAADKVRLDGLPSTATREFAARSEVATASIDAGISQIRTAGYAASGDGGGARYLRAGTEPAHALKVQSADGAWWELVAENGRINVLQAGADPTGAADSIQAFRDCADFARYNTATEEAGGANGPIIVVPQGRFHWSDTFEPRTGITLLGSKRGVNGNLGSIIEVAADKTAIILPKNDTIGEGREDPDDTSTKGANGSHIHGLFIQSLGGTDQSKHGIRVRVAGVTLEHLDVRDFPGDGFHISASVGTTDDSLFGNANLWTVRQCTAHRNQLNGIYVNGSDANGGVCEACNLSSNGRWGVWDDAFLSNVHIGHHAVGNGHGTSGVNQANGETATVTHNGEWWHVVPGQEAAASTTEPGTDAAVWFQVTDSGGTKSATAELPAWQSGDTYVSGGSYYFSSGVKTGIGLYAEDDNWAAMHGLAHLIGGFNSVVQSLTSPSGNSGAVIEGGNIRQSGLSLTGQANRVSEVSRVLIISPENPNAFLSFFYDNGPSLGQSFSWDSGGGLIRALSNGASNSWAMEITTAQSAISAGRSTDQPGQGNVNFPRGIFMGISNNSRFLGTASAAPTSGGHARGDVYLNIVPSVQTDTDGVDWIVHGWHCTPNGDPGTWQTMWLRVSNPPGLT